MEIDVVADAAIEDRRLLLVRKQLAPDVLNLPGGQRDAGEDDLTRLRRALTRT